MYRPKSSRKTLIPSQRHQHPESPTIPHQTIIQKNIFKNLQNPRERPEKGMNKNIRVLQKTERICKAKPEKKMQNNRNLQRQAG